MINTQIIRFHMNAIADRVGEKGLAFHVCRDPDEVAEKLAQVGKQQIHPMSQVEESEMVQGDAFWLFLQRGDHAVACISAKHIDLKGATFDDYMKGIASQRYGKDRRLITEVARPLVVELRGKLIYFGGIEFAEGERGSNKLLCDFAQYAKLQAALDWDFDWMYTIIAYKHRRLADDYGFHWRIRNAVQWEDPAPDGLASDQMILATNDLHFSHVLDAVEPGQL